MKVWNLNCVFAVLGMFVVLATSPPHSQAACGYQPDAADCTCFSHDGGWAPTGTYIQDFANATVGTHETCHQPSPPVDDDCGKPYYQLILGMNTVPGALMASYVLSVVTDPPLEHRQEWCSETVSYWHREAGIPYTLGYWSDWYENWLIKGVPKMREWYETEDAAGGRGRWIRSEQIDYEAGILGETIPTPGAYMAISCYQSNPPSWCDPAVRDLNHSVMVNEVWIHKDADGNIFRVKATFYEGNNGRAVVDSRIVDDIFSVTVRGSQWFGNHAGPDGIVGTSDDYGRKIYGFGIPLDASGDPIYDASRLHIVNHPEIRRAVLTRPRIPEDDTWKTFHLPIRDKLLAYAQALINNGGAGITCSSQDLNFQDIPNGKTVSWVFPDSLKGEEVVVDLDYLNSCPRDIEAIVFHWSYDFIPASFNVQVSKDNQNWVNATVPDMSGFQPLGDNYSPIPVKAAFTTPATNVRYVRIQFPAGILSSEATLEQMNIVYEPGPSEDTDQPEDSIPLFVDVRPGNCPNLLNSGFTGTISVALLGTDTINVSNIYTNSILLNGVSVTPDGISFQDLSTPFIGTDPLCHDLGGDGDMDLILTYDEAGLVAALGLEERRGETVPIVVTGTLKGAQTSEPFVGQDFIRLFTPIPHMLLLEEK